MAFHQFIQRLLLIGAHLEQLPPAPAPRPPEVLVPLIESIANARRAFDQRALLYGHRYRSGFWMIYMLSAIAVLFAVLPMALGWDSPQHQLHSYAALWALGEVIVIASVSVIYWRGHRHRWQGEWLRARTTAELSRYLPLLAPLIDFSAPATEPNWYMRVFAPHQHLRTGGEIGGLCSRNEVLARERLTHAWSDQEFVASYSRWAIEILEEQRHYHHGIATRQHALLHRVHLVTSWLFGLTAAAALTHLVVHKIWLTMITTFFPAFGASLHGALAQSEAYRLGKTSERLVAQLQNAIDSIRGAITGARTTGGGIASIQRSIEQALRLILDEHQDWHLLVRPHALPLG